MTGNKTDWSLEDDVGAAEAVALALGVPYRKWVWSAEHFSANAAGRIIALNGGLSVNYTLWPLGLGGPPFDDALVLLLSGDECLDWEQTVDDLAGALSQFQVYPFIGERLRHSIGLVEVLECSIPLPDIPWGTAINQCKQEVCGRVPGLLAPQNQAVSALACLDSPLLSARIATRVAHQNPRSPTTRPWLEGC